MEKIIYLYLWSEREKGSVKKPGFFSRFFIKSYPFFRKEAVLYGCLVVGYEIRAAGWPECEETVRFEKTLKELEACVAAEKTEESPVVYGWQNPVFPAELQTGFYESFCALKGQLGYGAEQLILMESDENSGYKQVSKLLKEVYFPYNYVTVVTKKPEAYEQLQAQIYEDTGLMIRCEKDARNLRFPEKKTVALDWRKEITECYKNLPEGTLYLDFASVWAKKRKLWVKCRGIRYFSLGNTLDTDLHNTV